MEETTTIHEKTYYGIVDNQKGALLPYLAEVLPEYITKMNDAYYLVGFKSNEEALADHTTRVLSGIAKIKYGCTGLSRYSIPQSKSTKTQSDFVEADKEPPSFAEMLHAAVGPWDLGQALSFFDQSGDNKEREIYDLATSFYYIGNNVGYEQVVQWAGKRNIYLFLQWVSNAYLSGSKAIHSVAFSSEEEAEEIIGKEGYIETSPINFGDIFKKWVLQKDLLLDGCATKVEFGFYDMIDKCLDYARN